MAHFAKLENNIVTEVVVVDNDNILDDDGNESESAGIAFLQNLFGADTVWKQTSFNANFRVKYAGIGDTYRADLDAFIEPCPFASFTFNETTFVWDPPTPRPPDTSTTTFIWDEDNQQWVEMSMVE